MATLVDELSSSELPALGAGGTGVVGDGPLEVMVVCTPGPMTSDGGYLRGRKWLEAQRGLQAVASHQGICLDEHKYGPYETITGGHS